MTFSEIETLNFHLLEKPQHQMYIKQKFNIFRESKDPKIPFKCQMSKTFTGSAVCPEFESEALAYVRPCRMQLLVSNC